MNEWWMFVEDAASRRCSTGTGSVAGPTGPDHTSKAAGSGCGAHLLCQDTVQCVPDRRTPLRLTDEKGTLLDFLGYLRESVILKVDHLDEAAARRSSVPTGTNLLGLIKHLTTVEALWFQFAFAGQDITVPGDELGPSDTVTSAVAAYRDVVRASNEIVDLCDDLNRLCARALTTPEPLSLRWLLVHMVEETARHAGHADILREQIDGSTGR